MRNEWKKANVKFVTAWDINARRYVAVNKVMKRKARKVARKNLTKDLLDKINQE